MVPKTLAVAAARHAALDDLETACELAGQFGSLVAAEEQGALRAAEALDRWAATPASGEGAPGMATSAAAERVGASIAVRRDPRNGYQHVHEYGCRPAQGDPHAAACPLQRHVDPENDDPP